MLDGKPRPLKRELPLEKAERIQRKLQHIGVGARVEAIPAVAATTLPELTLEPIEDTPASSSAAKSCPKCGHEQLGGETCERCGVVFDKVMPPPDDEHSDQRRQYTPEDLLPEFLAVNVERYLPKFQRFSRLGGKFAPTWHWPATFAPYLWALYRKLWVWALLMWLATFLLPFGFGFGLVVMMSHGYAPSPWLVGALSLLDLALWLVWPLTANYLYYRYAMRRLGLIAQRYRGDDALDRAADAGGVSGAAVVLGILASLLVMTGLSSLLSPRLAAIGQHLARSRSGAIESVSGRSHRRSDLHEDKLTPEQRETMTRLESLAIGTRVWLIRHSVTSAGLLDPKRLSKDLEVPDSTWRDAWRRPIRFETHGQAYSFRSAGADGRYNTADDLVLTNHIPGVK